MTPFGQFWPLWILHPRQDSPPIYFKLSIVQNSSLGRFVQHVLAIVAAPVAVATETRGLSWMQSCERLAQPLGN